MSVNIQTGNRVTVQDGNRVLISAPGPQGAPGTGGTPGGSDTQVQFNDGGSFGGNAALTFNKTTGTLSATHIHGSLAGNLYVHVKNTSGSTLAKGTPVYATGSVGASGTIEVAAADYTNAAKMPAIGIIDTELAVNAEGNAVVVGEVTGLATNSYAINQELFVGTSELLDSLPTSGQAQSIAVVSRVHASTGIVVVNSQGRLNAALRALANNDGSSLTGITAAQVGAVADGDSPSFAEVTLGSGVIKSQTGALQYDYFDAVDSTAVPYVQVNLYDGQDPPALIGHSIFGFRGDGSGSGEQIFQGSTNNFQFEGIGGLDTATVYASQFSGGGVGLTNLNASSLSSGTVSTSRLPTIPVANGGTGDTTHTANAVLLGNGTSPFLEVLPGTSGNVFTSNGTTWISAAPAASGTKTIAFFTPRDNQPPASNFATLDTRNSIAVLDFDTATEESAIFVGVIPEAAVLTSGITVRITWAASTATSGDCRWGVQWMRCNTDIDSDSFDAATEATTTTNGTSGIPSTTTITCTAIDSLAVGEMYRLKIYRDTGDAADTMTGDAELLTVEARTAN